MRREPGGAAKAFKGIRGADVWEPLKRTAVGSERAEAEGFPGAQEHHQRAKEAEDGGAVVERQGHEPGLPLAHPPNLRGCQKERIGRGVQGRLQREDGREGASEHA